MSLPSRMFAVIAALALTIGIAPTVSASAATPPPVSPSLSGTFRTANGVTSLTVDVRAVGGYGFATGTVTFSYGAQFAARGVTAYAGGSLGPRGSIATIALPRWSPGTRVLAVRFLSGNKGKYLSRVVAMTVTFPELGTRSNPFRAGTSVQLTDWRVLAEPTNTDAWARVRADGLGGAPAAGYRYVVTFIDIRYVGTYASDPFFDLDVAFIGADGRTYTDTNKLYWTNNLYHVGTLYYYATGQFATIVEVPAAAVAGGRWRIDDTSDYFNIRTAWFGLS